ncbi:hypothetical protein VitviT2T_019666 [Vitis vinifera]|uniref:Phenylalanine N-monooxygenase n=3 Tax=Vitis vinifera TaxID=29760 RepID=A0ABY9D184_VITVI|nr:hypothetical protein VitviT2T_019666 [Vitis vinifera]
MGSSSNSTLFSSILFLSPANDAAIDDVLSHLTFLLMLFIISVILNFTKFKSKTSTNSKSMMLPPGPAPWPLVRNLPHLLNRKPTFRWIHGFMKEMNTEIECIQLGDVHVIPVTSPEISREFLKKHDTVLASRPITMVTEYSSGGFLTTAVVPWGEQWKKMRRVLASKVINPSTFRWLHDKRVEEADNLVRYVYNQCKISTSNNCLGSVINVRNTVRQYSGNAIRKMILNTRYFGEGKQDGGPGVEEEQHVESLFTVLAHLYAFSLSDYFPWFRVLDLDGHEKTVREAMNTINKYHDPIVDQRVEHWRNGEKEAEDLLDVFISIKDSNGEPLLSVAEIKAQCTELILAAVDNPSNAIEWAMAEMINQPRVLGKAVEEIDRVVGKERLVQESNFQQLNYVKACIKEAFRLHPIAPFNLPHVSNADAIVASYFIPKGSHVLLSRLGLGRNPRIWEEPLIFNPERHLNASTAQGVDLNEQDLRLISFSTGRRGCTGIAFGSAMTVMLLVRLLQGFTWSPPPGQKEVDLSESRNDLFLANPLHALAKPRLHSSLL